MRKTCLLCEQEDKTRDFTSPELFPGEQSPEHHIHYPRAIFDLVHYQDLGALSARFPNHPIDPLRIQLYQMNTTKICLDHHRGYHEKFKGVCQHILWRGSFRCFNCEYLSICGWGYFLFSVPFCSFPNCDGCPFFVTCPKRHWETSPMIW